MPAIERINSRAIRFLNQRFYSSKVGTYAIELPESILLVDLPTHTPELEEMLRAYDRPVRCILSHGSCGIPDGTIWQNRLDMEVWMHEADRSSEWLKMKPDVLFTKPPYFADDIEFLHTPGHNPGSVCVLDHATKTLFTGDTLAGRGGRILDIRNDPHDEDGALRLKSVRSLLDQDFDSIHPFHDEPIAAGAKERLREYLESIG